MIAASSGFLARGAVNVINLDELKAEAGERWTRICDGVHARLESLLRGMLGPADFFARINDTAHLVTMPTSAPEDVNLICLRAAFELHTSLLGECRIDQLSVGTAMPGGRDGELAMVPIPADRLSILARKAGIHPAPLALPAPATALIVKHQFLPLWTVQNAAITTYLCEPNTITSPYRRDALPLNALEPAERIEVEMSCFRHGIAHLHQAIATGRHFILAVALSFDMLGAPAGREAVLTCLRDLPRLLRNHLVFFIRQVPPGVAQTRLGTLVNLLRPFGRGVSATIFPHSRLLHAYPEIGLKAVGFALNEFGAGLPDQHEIEALASFARRNRLAAFVSHIGNIKVLQYARDAGIQQLSGTAIALACAEPQGVLRLTWQMLTAEPMADIRS